MGPLHAGEGAVGDFQKTTAFRIRRAQASVAKEGMYGHVYACVRACEYTRKRATHPQKSKGVRVTCKHAAAPTHLANLISATQIANLIAIYFHK